MSETKNVDIPGESRAGQDTNIKNAQGHLSKIVDQETYGGQASGAARGPGQTEHRHRFIKDRIRKSEGTCPLHGLGTRRLRAVRRVLKAILRESPTGSPYPGKWRVGEGNPFA